MWVLLKSHTTILLEQTKSKVLVSIPYRIVRASIRVGFQTYFQKIYFINKENIPEKGPIIFAVNHPTAFLEPMIHTPFMKHSSYFLLRGDYFNATWARITLNSLHIIPVFRQRDGVGNLRKNLELFDLFQKMLHEDKNITVMVEGSHDFHKRLRKVQRGTARMTIGTYKEYGDDDITILPMGVSFSDVTAFRSMVMVKFGKPIVFKDYLEKVEQNERKVMLEITALIQERLRKCMVHIEHPEDDEVTDQLLDMNRHDARVSFFLGYSEEGDLLEEEIKIANIVNEMSETEKSDFKSKMQHYQDTLKAVGTNDAGVSKQYILNVWNTLFVFLGFPFFVLSCIVHLPMIILVKTAMGMNPKTEFITSLGLAASSFGYPLYWLLWIIVALVIWNKWLLIFVAFMPFLAYLSLYYWDMAQYWRAAWRFRQLKSDKQQQILQAREAVLQFITE